LYAQDRNPISSLMALEGLRAFERSLPVIVNDPKNTEARSDALYGAWLCGSVLGTVGMALHHKICHTLGGSFDTPHAETHAVMLPHTAAFNA
ncbi:iron-containing alcohol dehydrogenase, partial [Escherichia coli]|nr:iron-containing alcohol dehydrogenase [Escherichia coli]